jgi:hypothetical protein
MNATALDVGRSLDLSVDNTAFLVDRLGSDCGPLQFVRELTQNALEAGATEILWDTDDVYAKRDIHKLCIIDNGAGMSSDDLLHSIRKLFVRTAKEQGLTSNFGVGAKISTLTRNPYGVVYVSKAKGQPAAMVHIWRDSVTGSYGFKQLLQGDDMYGHFLNVKDDALHQLIQKAGHGTMVVLLGRNETEDTTQPPEGAFPIVDPWGRSLRVRWLHRYLNSRYFDFPKGVNIRVRAFSDIPRERQLSKVTGQREYLDNHAKCTGITELSTARVYWWILKRDVVGGDAAGWNKVHVNTGHVAALYRNELYDVAIGKSGVNRLQRCGVIMGHRQVVLYFEPTLSVVPNTARTTLLQSNEADHLPWDTWEDEFRNNMPQEIRAHVDELSAASASLDHKQAIYKRLEEIKDLFKLPKFRPVTDGTYMVSPAGDVVDEDVYEGMSPQLTETPGEEEQAERTEPQERTPSERDPSPYSYYASNEGKPAKAILNLEPPEARWVSTRDGTREAGDLEDRAARYLAEQNLLLLNRDFRVFQAAVERWQHRYGNRPGVGSVVENKVLEWAEQVLVEAVLGMKSFKGSKAWTLEDLQRAISEEALTCAAQPRSFVEDRLRHSLSIALGPLSK